MGVFFLPRPRKFETPAVLPVKSESSMIDRARDRARADGTTLNRVINEFLASYATPNSPFEKLKVEVYEQRKIVAREQTKLAALELRLKQKTLEIPEDYIRYWAKKRKEWNAAQRLQFLDTSAKKLNLKREELGQRLDKLADEITTGGSPQRPRGEG